jgi:transposase-like protein
MDTNPRTGRAYKRGPYKRHSVAFKRAVVEASFAPGASVSRVAREHDINANQVFLWRKLYQDGLLGDDEPALLPVHINEPARKPLPDHLPRETVEHAPMDCCCPDCGGALKKLGEDVSETLEYRPEHFKVIRHVRPKLACARCDTIVQAPAAS